MNEKTWCRGIEKEKEILVSDYRTWSTHFIMKRKVGFGENVMTLEELDLILFFHNIQNGLLTVSVKHCGPLRHKHSKRVGKAVCSGLPRCQI